MTYLRHNILFSSRLVERELQFPFMALLISGMIVTAIKAFHFNFGQFT